MRKNRIIGLIIILIISGCYTKKRAIEKLCHQDSVIVTIHDTITVTLPQDTGRFSLAIDSLKKKIAELESDSALPEPPVRIIYEDSLVQLTAQLIKKTKSLQWQLTHKKPLVKEIPVTVKVKVPCNCPPIPDEPWWWIIVKVLAVIGGIAIIIVVTRLFIKLNCG